MHVLVTGATGFIGHHLVRRLRAMGHTVRGADIRTPEYGCEADEFVEADLREVAACRGIMRGIDQVYALAADMGGMGFISAHHALILHGNSLIDLNTLEAARLAGVKRLLYASSACIYPEQLQTGTDVAGLKEDDAYPAQPQDAYGWEKLMTERLCFHYAQDYGLETRVVRFHNVYGPEGTWDGGREKAPAAICRKVALAKLTRDHTIAIWGDGEQTRSFCYIDDVLQGLPMLMASGYAEPLNMGSDRLISINAMVAIVEQIAGVTLTRRHVEGPQGVRGRNSDNTRLTQVLGWAPGVTLEEGLARTYAWIERQVAARLAAGATA